MGGDQGKQKKLFPQDRVGLSSVLPPNLSMSSSQDSAAAQTCSSLPRPAGTGR